MGNKMGTNPVGTVTSIVLDVLVCVLVIPVGAADDVNCTGV